MITVKNISKRFGSFSALQNVSFDIGKGEIVGFLGQNGAGKTTLMRIMTSYLTPSTGEVYFDDINVQTYSLKARQRLGYLPETPPLYPEMNVQSYLRFAAQLKNVSIREVTKSVDRALSDCQLNDVRRKRIGILSKGYKQRVGIAQAIINNPDILILDEPTSGLDPVQMRQVRNLMKNLEHKRTVILSTHILSEIEQIVKRVLFIKAGRVVADSSMDSLLAAESNSFDIHVESDEIRLRKIVEEIINVKVIDIKSNGILSRIRVLIEDEKISINNVLNVLISNNIPIVEVSKSIITLEEKFIQLVS